MSGQSCFLAWIGGGHLAWWWGTKRSRSQSAFVQQSGSLKFPSKAPLSPAHWTWAGDDGHKGMRLVIGLPDSLVWRGNINALDRHEQAELGVLVNRLFVLYLVPVTAGHLQGTALSHPSSSTPGLTQAPPVWPDLWPGWLNKFATLSILQSCPSWLGRVVGTAKGRSSSHDCGAKRWCPGGI